MEGNESVDIGQDTREKLEEDVRSHFWHHDCCRTDMVLGWLDRQAAITERYWMYLTGCTANATVEINKQRETLENENEGLRGKLEALEYENESLREELEIVEDENKRLQSEMDAASVSRTNEDRKNAVRCKRLCGRIAELRAENDGLCMELKDVLSLLRLGVRSGEGISREWCRERLDYYSERMHELGVEVPE